MKNFMQRLTYKSISIILTFSFLFISVEMLAGGEKVSINDTIVIQSEIPIDGNLELTNRHSDVKFIVWNQQSVKIVTQVEIKGGTVEDNDKIIDAIKEIEITKNGNLLKINTRFYKEKRCKGVRTKFTFSSGNSAKVGSCKVRHTIYIPKKIDLNLTCKYCDISLPTLDGNVVSSFHNADLIANSINGNIKMEAKYSDIVFKNVKSSKIELYNSELKMNNCGNLEMEARYSEIEIFEASNVKIPVSYNNEMEIENCGKFTISDKYSEISLGNCGIVDFTAYNSELSVNNAGNMFFNTKYSEIRVGKTGNTLFRESYNDTFYAMSVKSLEIMAKYGEFKTEKVSGSINFEGYNAELTVQKIEPNFGTIVIKGKYGDIYLGIVKGGSYLLNSDTKYTDISFPENDLKISTRIEKNSDKQLSGHYGSSDSKNSISIEGFNQDVTIRHK